MNFFFKLFLILNLLAAPIFAGSLTVETRIHQHVLYVGATNNITGMYPLAFNLIVRYTGVKVKTNTINNTRYLGTSYCSSIKTDGSYSYFEVTNDGTLFNKTNLNPIFFSVELEKVSSSNYSVVVSDSPKTKRPIIANNPKFTPIPHTFDCSRTFNMKFISAKNFGGVFNDIIMPKKVRVC